MFFDPSHAARGGLLRNRRHNATERHEHTHLPRASRPEQGQVVDSLVKFDTLDTRKEVSVLSKEPSLQSQVQSQRVLIVCEDAALREELALAVQRGGATPVRAPGLASLAGQTLTHRLVVFAWEGMPLGLQTLLSKLRESAQVLALVPQKSLAEQVVLLRNPQVNTVLTIDDRVMWMVQVTVAKFVAGDLFGIEKYLPPDTEIHLTRLRDFQGREKAITEVLAYAEKAGVRSRIRDKIGTVCTELLMNALYDAPVDDRGHRVFENVTTKERIEQLTPRPVSIRFAASGGQFAVAVRDRFGSLDKGTILRYIEKCLSSPNQIDRKTYGAGLGIYLVASAATYYVVNIAPGMATEVICTFDSGTPTPLRALSVFLYPGASTSTGAVASSSSTGQHPIPAPALAQHPSIANPAKPGKA